MVKSVLHILTIAAVLHVAREVGIIILETELNPYLSFAALLAIFAINELVVHPILRLVLLPIRLITFGIASTLISVALVYAVVQLYPPLTVSLIYIFLLGFIFALLQKAFK